MTETEHRPERAGPRHVPGGARMVKASTLVCLKCGKRYASQLMYKTANGDGQHRCERCHRLWLQTARGPAINEQGGIARGMYRPRG